MKFTRGRKVYGKRRKPYRKFNISKTVRVLRSIRKDNIVSLKRSFVYPGGVGFYSNWTGQQFSFGLSDCPSYTDFTNVFEQYRINAVKLTFMPYGDGIDYNQMYVNAGAGGASVNTVTFPRIYTALDFDGNARYASENDILQYGNHRIIKDTMKPFSIYIRKPRVEFATANALTLVGGAPKKSPWLDVDNYAVKHWGCVIGGIIPYAVGINATIQYNVVCTYYLQFKNAL